MKGPHPPLPSCALGICLVWLKLLAFRFIATVPQFRRLSSDFQRSLFNISTPVLTVNS